MNPIRIIETAAGATIVVVLFELFLIAAYSAFWLWALVHCIKHRLDKDRMMWVLIIIFVPLFGMILYFTIGRQPSGPAAPVPVPPQLGIPPTAPGNGSTAAFSFDHAAMHDEKKRAAAIAAALSAGTRSRRKPTD